MRDSMTFQLKKGWVQYIMRSPKASIHEIDKGKRYRVFVEAGRDPKTGKRVRHTRVVRGSRTKAEQVKAEMLARVGYTDTIREEMTLSQFFDAMFLPDAKVRLRPTTVSGYAKHYDTHVRDDLGGQPLGKITPLSITLWLSGIDGQARKFEAFKLLRLVLSKAVKWDLMDSNPCKRVDPPKKASYKPEVLDAQDAAVYLWHFSGHQIEPAIIIALGAGLRRSEICALDWADVTPSGAISVHHGITVVDGKPHDDDTKTEFSHRTVHLPQSFAERLNAFRRPSGPVVTDSDGKRIHPDVLTRSYIRWRDKLPEGVPRVSLKNLRHSSLTILVDSGVDILTASRRAGHSNVGITSAYYLRPHATVDRAAASRLDEAFGSL